jgi:hypothetical protein
MKNQKTLLPQSNLPNQQNFNIGSEVTTEELNLANLIIEKAWQNAKNSSPESSEVIWNEFDQIRERIANSDSQSN